MKSNTRLLVMITRFLVLLAVAQAQIGPLCHMMPRYPPSPSQKLPHSVVDLDKRPEDRWTDIVTPLAPYIKNVISTFMKNKTQGSGPIAKILKMDLPMILGKFGADYAGEMRGIAKAANISMVEIVGLNLAYEIEGLCTGIVAQGSDGSILHGRNLDFGLLSGHNETGQWALTAALRPTLQTIDFQKGGKTLFQQVQFVGYIGCHTCVKKGGFSANVNTRYDTNMDKGLIEWLLKDDDKAKPACFAVRDAFHTQDTYAGALDYLTKQKYVGPSYVIMGGVKAGEGAIISIDTENKKPLMDVYHMSSTTDRDQDWFVVQTNYDHWNAPPPFDDRRLPAEACLNWTTQAKFDQAMLYDIITAVPNRNELTTFSTIMSGKDGLIGAWMEHCIPEKEPMCTFVPW